MVNKAFVLILAAALITAPAQGDFLNSISNAFGSAANSVSSGLNTATNAVGSGLNTATNAVGNGLNTATNATSNALSTAANATSGWVSTATGSVRDAYNVSSGTLRNFTSDVRNAVAPAADSVSNTAQNLGNSVYNVSSGTYRGVVNTARNVTGQNNNSNSSSSGNTTQAAGVDTTSASSIISTLTANSTGYIPFANSFLVALGQNKSTDIQTAIRNIVNNSTGNTSYPSQGINDTVSLALAQGIVTGLITANNYTVTVDFNGATNRVNASQVSNTFIAGLQDGVTPCARNVTSGSNTTAGSSDYFALIASRCCFLVSQPLTYTEALSQANGVSSIYEQSLTNSQSLGTAPSLDLTRCLSNTTSVS